MQSSILKRGDWMKFLSFTYRAMSTVRKSEEYFPIESGGKKEALIRKGLKVRHDM